MTARFGALVALVGINFVGGALLAPARCDAQSAPEKALAESLFREAKRLLAQKSVPEACRKLEESQRLDPALGTLLNLASCHEKEGKIAAAWSEYQAAAEQARTAHRPDRGAIATKKYKELDPVVPRLTIAIAWRAPRGTEVKLDGTSIGLAAIGTPLAADPGPHTVAISAPEHETLELRLTLDKGDAVTITPPPLEPVRKGATTSAASESKPQPSSFPWLPVGIAAAGLSAVSLAIGTGLGVHAFALGDVVSAQCPRGACSAEGLEAYESGQDFATGADVGFAMGGVFAAASAVAFVFAAQGDGGDVLPPPSDSKASFELSPIVAPSLAGASARVRF